MALERMDPDSARWFELGVLREHTERYEFAQSFARGDVLDIACGTGYGSAMLATRAKSVTGVDIAPDAVAIAKERNSGVTFMAGDASALPFEDRHFNEVVSFETIEHLPPACIPLAIAEFARVLQDGGRLIISTPERESFSLDRHSGNPFHTSEFTLAEFSQLISAHFDIESVHGQKFSRRGMLRLAKGAAAISSHAFVSKLWRAYKMIVCRDAKVVEINANTKQVPMILVVVARKRAT